MLETSIKEKELQHVDTPCSFTLGNKKRKIFKSGTSNPNITADPFLYSYLLLLRYFDV